MYIFINVYIVPNCIKLVCVFVVVVVVVKRRSAITNVNII